MKAFDNGKPNISSSERTSNVKAKNIYSHMINVADKCGAGKSGRNYTGTIQFNKDGNVTNYRSYALSQSMAKGAAFISDCNCNGMPAVGGFESWNTNGIKFDLEGISSIPTTMKYWNTATNTWTNDSLNNTMTLDGSGVWVDPNNNLFGSRDDCVTDKWKKYSELIDQYKELSGNNTKKNYLYAYVPAGSHSSTKAGIGRSLRPKTGVGKSCCD